MKNAHTPQGLDLVLAGGGHAHVAVLRRLGMKPVPGLRVTLVCDTLDTPYSGMLPGLIAGHYRHETTHIDLRRLARFAGATIVHAPVTGVDADTRRIHLPDRPALRYDLLSLNIGSTPAWHDVPGAAEHGIPVKPVPVLVSRLAGLRQNWGARDSRLHLAVVGTGAGGVELALALAHRLRGLPKTPTITLYGRRPGILEEYSRAVQMRFMTILQARSIGVVTGQAVVAVDDASLTLEGGHNIRADAVFWATEASAPGWLTESGLALDDRGFVRVQNTLQSSSHPAVFAAGDIAALPVPKPKSGVFAVRAGSVLAANIVRSARGGRLIPFRARKKSLALIGTGDRQAVASRGRLTLQGRPLWWLKDRIDRRFIARYSELPPMPTVPTRIEPEHERLPKSGLAPGIRCGGGSAKVAPGILGRVLERLRDDGVGVFDGSIERRADAAVFTPPAGRRLLQSFDYLRDFVGDPYLLGEIAVEHALNDLYATGATPHSVLVHAGVPRAAAALMEEQLYQMLAGAQAALARADTTLLGGHSSQSSHLGIGFAVNGVMSGDQPTEPAIEPAALPPGSALILTQPLGVGVLFAADQQYRAEGRWIDAAIAHMRQSAAGAAARFAAHGVFAATDITGVGLAGDLDELLARHNAAATVVLDDLPLLDGAVALATAGVRSSLHDANTYIEGHISADDDAQRHAAWPLLFDPQTAGGLLAVVPESSARDCVQALRVCGYAQAARIGRIDHRPEGCLQPRMRLVARQAGVKRS